MTMRFCRRLMITSDAKRFGQVPAMNLRIKTSSTVVCDVFFVSPSRLPAAENIQYIQSLPSGFYQSEDTIG